MAELDVPSIDAQIAAVYEEHGRDRGRERIVHLAYPLMEHLARRFAGRGEPLDDLIQVASVGLLKSIARFEPERGIRFSTYATPTILGELKRYFRDSGWAMHVPRRLKERALLIRDISGDLAQETGRSPTAKEIAARTGLTLEEVVEALDAGAGYTLDSLDAPQGEDGPVMTLGGEDRALEFTEQWTSVAPLLRELEPREREILYLRFVRGLTQSQIGERVGFSQMHVSRILDRTLTHLRELARAEPPTR